MKVSIQSTSQWVKKHPIIIVTIILVLGVFWFFYSPFIKNILTITVPSNPLFGVVQFKFHNFPYYDERNEALLEMFPVGTNRAFVREVLDNSDATGKLKEFKKPNQDLYQYIPGTYAVNYQYLFIYDENNNLSRISCSVDGSCYIYSKKSKH